MKLQGNRQTAISPHRHVRVQLVASKRLDDPVRMIYLPSTSVSRQLDRWSQIGVPLIVFVSAPSSNAPDPLARHPARPLPNLRGNGVTPAWQHVLLQWLLPLLLAKQQVQAIAWDCFLDDQPHDMPTSGLCESASRPKPAFQTLIDLRRDTSG